MHYSSRSGRPLICQPIVLPACHSDAPAFSTFRSILLAFFGPQGYLPANSDRRSSVLERRRAEYRGFVDMHFPTREDGVDNKRMLHQIQVDLVRSAPASLFGQKVVTNLFERLLFVYGALGAVRLLLPSIACPWSSSFSGHILALNVECSQSLRGVALQVMVVTPRIDSSILGTTADILQLVTSKVRACVGSGSD